jgi:two-component system, chemotaxis family, CheB/CheR fusion protein
LPIDFKNTSQKYLNLFDRRESLTMQTRIAKKKKSTVPDLPANGKDDHFIVCIGASAGGMEAIHDLFDKMPQDTGFSFIVIQHLSSEYKSLMAELLSKHTTMNVVEAKDGVAITPNTVYVIPNNRNITVHDRKLKLSEKEEGRSPNMAIDIFLHSLAKDVGKKAIAVILSGTGSDGTKGIHAIKKAGGLVFVQDPLSAKFDGMPHSAIASGKIDYILSPESIAEELVMRHHVALPTVIVDSLPAEDEPVLSEILDLIHSKTSCDFKSYKRPTLVRRLTRRMAILNYKTPRAYLDFLRKDGEEVNFLCKEFLIGVTRFFRDPEAFEELKLKVIPEIVKAKSSGEMIKVWVAGCSTGEEVYSIAILFREHFNRIKTSLDIKIFASDVNKESTDFASKGVYPESIAKDIPKELLEKYFIRDNKKYRVASQVRKMIVFSHHDLLRDAPFGRLDLICCRNMLIYVAPELQKRIMGIFHFSLNLGGYLFLGSSENIGDLKDSVVEVSKKWKIYKNTRLAKSMGLDTLTYSDALTRKFSPAVKIQKEISRKAVVESLVTIMMDEYTAAGALVDKNCIVIETFGDYRKYLQLPEKKFDHNLLKMIPPKASIVVGSNFRKAVNTNEKFVIKNVAIREPGNVRANITIKPFDDSFSNQLVFVLFNDVKKDATVRNEKETPRKKGRKVDGTTSPNFDDFIRLENELRETKEILQRAIEDSETSNEELQSSNEELISSNEELQSTNEELQSLNEELHTVNAEHQLRIKEISELNDDLNNYFRSTDIAQIFLDSNLLIRKYTPPATVLINLIETDIGRPITHISNNLKYPGLFDDIGRVLKTSEPVSKIIDLYNNTWFQMKVLPYVREGKNIDGVVLMFVDITAIKNAQAEVTEEVKARKALEEVNAKLNSLNEEYKRLTKELEMRVEERTKDLRDVNEKLLKSNRELEQFAYITSHDLHEPLRKIQTFAELAERSWNDEPVAKKYLNRIASSSARMTALINDVLNYSRITRSTDRAMKTDLNDILARVKADFARQMEEKNATVKSSGLPTINGIPSQLQQLFASLISNSLKFSGQDVEIEISSREVAPEEAMKSADLPTGSKYAELVFKDNGIGFDQQFAKQIFTIFEKLNPSYLYSGSGIGLALCKRIVENHGGAILASSRLNNGATFKVYLPLN